MPSCIDKIENAAKALMAIDLKNPDRRITKSEYDVFMQKYPTLVKDLVGKEVSPELSWDHFKDLMIDYLRGLGILWKKSQGMYGTLSLENVEFPKEFGEELAQVKYQELKGSKLGEIEFGLRDLITQSLPVFNKYIEKTKFSDFRYSNLINLRSRFTGANLDGKFRFSAGNRGANFKLTVLEYKFKGTEYELGELMKSAVQACLDLKILAHTQDKRGKKVYMNEDFYGLKIIEDAFFGDIVKVVTIELKISNSVSDISNAVSQAVNYKDMSHMTYIAIPLFNAQSFYDEERYNSLINMCKYNGVGVLSVNLVPSGEKKFLEGIDPVTVELEPEIRNYADNTIDWRDKLKEHSIDYNETYRHCLLCKKFVQKVSDSVQKDSSWDRCAWQEDMPSDVPDAKISVCMYDALQGYVKNGGVNNQS